MGVGCRGIVIVSGGSVDQCHSAPRRGEGGKGIKAGSHYAIV